MFERYTEHARRAIFFARYETSQVGSPLIETEHLLLGILREQKELMRHLLPKRELRVRASGNRGTNKAGVRESLNQC